MRTILRTSIGVAAVCAALLAQQTAAAAPATAQGIITVKEFRNITGTAVTDLTGNAKFPNSPDLVAYVTYFEWPNGGDINTPPVNTEDNYGTQVIGYFYPPTTGNYVFFVCSDDSSELYLSEDDTAAKKHLIARETSYSDPRQYQTSSGGSDLTAKRSDQFTGTTWPTKNTITLTAGRAYYIEALHKEGTGGDNISAAVQDPLGMIDATLPIPGTYLSTIDRQTITQPYLKDFTGNFGGAWFYITEPGDTVTRSTAKLTLNGADVPITFTTVDSQTISASYRVAAPLAAGSTNTVSLQFTDSASRSQTINKQFVVAAYATLPPSYATTTFSGNGMKVYATQINFVDALGNLLPGRSPGDVNGTYNAERQIAGDFKNEAGVVYPNVANPVNSTVQTVNWELTGADITATPETGPDHFNRALPAGSPRPNAPIPGGDPSIAALGDANGPDNMAIAVTAFLELKQGFNRLVVNSDDGFTLRASPGIGEVIGGALLGSFDTGRGASDTWCQFWVQQDGVYPVRLLYWQGSGGASCEWFAEQPESLGRILVNDRTVTGAIKAYDTGTGRAYTKTVLPYPNEVASRKPDFKYQIVDDKSAYVSGSFKLTLDGAALTPTVSTSAGTTTATFTPAAEVPYGSAHTVSFEWVENTTPPTTNAYSYTYTTATFTVADLPANSFWIEVEDFDFNKGQSLPEASTMPYQGGAYANLTSPRPVLDTDYHRDSPGPQNNPPTDLTGAGYMYRTDIPEYTDTAQTVTDYFVPMYPDTGGIAGIRPGGLTVSVNYRTGWSGGSWYDYTRTVPQGVYNAYLAGGHWNDTDPATAGQISCTLATVTAGAGTATQTLQTLGAFYGPGAGYSGTDVLTPLNNADGTLAVFKANGKTTFRLTDSAGDIDWFVLVPTVVPAKFTGVLPDLQFALLKDTVIQWTFEDFSTTVNTNSIKLKLNGTDVAAAQLTIVKSATGTTTVTYKASLPNATYNYQLAVLDSASKDLSVTGTFTIGTPPPLALLVVGTVSLPTLNAADAGVKARLEGLGFQVKVIGDSASQTSDATGTALIVTSSTVSSGNVANKFQTVAVPVINWEQALEDNYLFAVDDATHHNSTTSTTETQVNIVKADHPLAAGFPTGPRAVSSGTQMSWGTPASSAIIIATTTEDATQAVIYGFETGATLVDGTTTAAARRVHFMMTDDTFATLNADGLKLFDAAVSWAANLLTSAPPKFNPVQLQGGNLTITWTGGGTLQTSTDLKAWSDVSGAGNGTHTAAAADAHRFFRVRQ